MATDRRWDTRAGTIELAIPRLRQGSYFPEWLQERRRRSEQALISVVATSYLLGVSTRRDAGRYLPADSETRLSRVGLRGVAATGARLTAVPILGLRLACGLRAISGCSAGRAGP
jgi:mutator family transposase